MDLGLPTMEYLVIFLAVGTVHVSVPLSSDYAATAKFSSFRITTGTTGTTSTTGAADDPTHVTTTSTSSGDSSIDIDTVAKQIVALDDHVAQIDSNAKLHPPILSGILVPLG